MIGRTAASAVLVALAYFALQWGVERWLGSSVPAAQAARGPVELALIAALVAAFVALTVFQSGLARKSGARRFGGLWAHVNNGFYVNTLANRLGVRFWPAPPPKAGLAEARAVQGAQG